MIQTRLKGMGVALITPFKEDESVDYDALMRLVDYLLQNNADFLCVLGTTAETPTLSEEEKKKFVQKLYRKLESGKKLSADEMQYLRKNDPVTYAKAAKVQVLRESLKKQLKSATSKEKAADIYTQAMSRISEDDPARKEIMAAYDDVYKEFRKSDEYKALPNTEKEAKEKAANNKNKNAQGWEEKEDDDTEMSVGEIDVVEKLM